MAYFENVTNYIKIFKGISLTLLQNISKFKEKPSFIVKLKMK